jgi:hypothetical protein
MEKWKTTDAGWRQSSEANSPMPTGLGFWGVIIIIPVQVVFLAS